MAYNKIVFGGETLIDLTSDSVSEGTLQKGYTAHDKAGNKITGTLVKPSGTITIANNGTHNVTNYANAEVNVPIPSGYIKPTGTKNISTNGTHDVTSYASASVNVPVPSDTTAGAGDILANKTAYIGGNKTSGTMTNNGAISKTLDTSTTSYTVPTGYHNGNGKVSITLEEKSATPSASSQTITPTSGKVLSKVTVNASPSGAYSVGHTLTAGAGSVSASGTNVSLTEVSTKPTSGYYITASGSGSVSGYGTATIGTAGWLATGSKSSTSSSKSSNTATKYYTLPAGSVPNPTISIDSAGKITASLTTTAGYIGATTPSNTKQLTTKGATTITPSTSAQTAVASGVYTTGAITVGAIPSNYIVPSGTKTITTNGTHDVKAYASATINVPIPSGYVNVTIDGVPQTSNLTFTSKNTFEKISTLPYKVSGDFFLHNGKLCFNYLYNIYQYDDSTNSWGQIATASSSSFQGWCKVSSINGTLVAIGNTSSTNHAIRYSYYNGSSWSSYSSLSSVYGTCAKLLVYNNELYLVGTYYMSRYGIYKWNGTSFTSLISDVFNARITTEYNIEAVVHNGLIHMILNGTGNYSTFDGTMATPNGTISPKTGLVSYKNKLYGFSGKSQYLFNPSDNSWTLVYTFDSGTQFPTAIVYQSKINTVDIPTSGSAYTHYASDTIYTLIE